MAKTYLNKDEKQFILVLAAFTTFIADSLDQLKGVRGVPEGVTTNLKTARTHSQKVIGRYMERLDHLEVTKIMAEAKKMTVAARYTTEAVDEYRRMLSLDTHRPMETEDLADLVSQLIENTCKQCRLTGALADDCRVRQLFIKYDVEPYNHEAPAGVCCYQYE